MQINRAIHVVRAQRVRRVPRPIRRNRHIALAVLPRRRTRPASRVHRLLDPRRRRPNRESRRIRIERSKRDRSRRRSRRASPRPRHYADRFAVSSARQIHLIAVSARRIDAHRARRQRHRRLRSARDRARHRLGPIQRRRRIRDSRRRAPAASSPGGVPVQTGGRIRHPRPQFTRRNHPIHQIRLHRQPVIHVVPVGRLIRRNWICRQRQRTRHRPARQRNKRSRSHIRYRRRHRLVHVLLRRHQIPQPRTRRRHHPRNRGRRSRWNRPIFRPHRSVIQLKNRNIVSPRWRRSHIRNQLRRKRSLRPDRHRQIPRRHRLPLCRLERRPRNQHRSCRCRSVRPVHRVADRRQRRPLPLRQRSHRQRHCRRDQRQRNPHLRCHRPPTLVPRQPSAHVFISPK